MVLSLTWEPQTPSEHLHILPSRGIIIRELKRVYLIRVRTTATHLHQPWNVPEASQRAIGAQHVCCNDDAARELDTKDGCPCYHGVANGDKLCLMCNQWKLICRHVHSKKTPFTVRFNTPHPHNYRQFKKLCHLRRFNFNRNNIFYLSTIKNSRVTSGEMLANTPTKQSKWRDYLTKRVK